jgi:tetratricopeptide (TPR) repeat protein
MLLGDAYLRNGRFNSARATYAEAVQLDPSNVRGALSVALIHIAQGHPAAAVGILDNIADRAPAADVGLAYALAGQAERAVDLLETAARSPMASARTRQNLALAYAFAGNWSRARAIAAQDISPAEVDARMAQWAQMARPGTGPAQVATLLGVAPGADAGRPLQVALGTSEPIVPGADRVQVAEASAPSHAQFAPAAVPAPAPTQLAAANDARPAEAPAFWAPAQAYQAEAMAEGPADGAVEVMPEPQPQVIRVRPHAVEVRSTAPIEQFAADAAPAAEVPVVQPRAPAPAPRRAAFIRAAAISALPRAAFQVGEGVRSGPAPVVVQLGAFSNEANAERAWQQVSSRYGLAGRRPLTTTFNYNGRTFHRVSVSGFASSADAQRLCGQIRAHGGICFVRATAGDASIRWAARYAGNPRQRDA